MFPLYLFLNPHLYIYTQGHALLAREKLKARDDLA
uniref:Uncharacterized protein n=1 Tax=Rhizophora mucronata TaxID=61149 RepID=A0A2P2N430_RHIMU